jgi:hypothetical protein
METADKGDRIAGMALVLGAALTVLAMAHHPTHLHPGPNGLNQLVHAVMIGLCGVMAFGFAHLALRRGLAHPTVLGGLVAYLIGLFGNVGAATINGFAVPALAARGKDAIGAGPFLLAWELNQALAGLAVFAVGAAFLLWSLGMIKRRDLAVRAVGVLGIAAGVVPAVLLATAAVSMNVAGAMLVYGLQAGWTVLAGFLLLSGRLTADESL